MTLPDRVLAQRIIETLGQAGTPPVYGVSYYNIGNESLLSTLENHYLNSYLADGGAAFKLVVGDYGSGKSHFLYCVRDRAWGKRYAVSKVDLSPKETPYNDQRSVYIAVAANVLWHDPADPHVPEKGLARFLTGTLHALVRECGLDPQDPQAAELPEVKAFLETLDRTPIDSMSFHAAIRGYFRALLQGDEAQRMALERWLHGETPNSDEGRLQRLLGVTDRITRNNAFKMLRSLCQSVRAIGYNGLVLLFDEGDRMMSLGGRAEREATDVLREVIDRCREDLPGALFMYATPNDFVTNIVPKYPALQQRLQAPSFFSRSNPFSSRIDMSRLDLDNHEFLLQLGQRLRAIFQVAFGITLDADIQTENVRILAGQALDTVLLTITAASLSKPW
ncbi:MAG: ATP-binding protein [Anaerolineae bacterium]|nr:ATP-binding protein [Anaerolineae bacterium]